MTIRKHRSTHVSSALLLFLVLISELAVTFSAQAATTIVSVYPSSVTAGVGQDFSINVNIQSVLNLYGWEFKLNWSASLLDVSSVIEGSFLRTGGDTFFSYIVNSTEGYVIVDCTMLGTIPGVSGDGVLATMTFHVKNSGECLLGLYSIVLLDSLEAPIVCQDTDGFWQSSVPHDVAITDVNISPIIILSGDFVNINVTTQNQGSYEESFNVTVYSNSQIINLLTVLLSSGSSTVIPFSWNTSGFGKGEYTISASASIVLGEVDTGDNSQIASDKVTILYDGHDVAVIDVNTSKTIVCQGYITLISANIKNFGTFYENIEVTIFANTSMIERRELTLTSGSSTTVTLMWNTTGFAYGNYTISAYAWPVPNETDTGDNTFVDGVVTVVLAGDLNDDGIVDYRDINRVARMFGKTPSDPQWDPNNDIIEDGIIDYRDINVPSRNYGKTRP